MTADQDRDAAMIDPTPVVDPASEADSTPVVEPVETPAEATAPAARAGRIPVVIVSVVFGLLYAWQLWQSVSNLVVLPSTVDAINASYGTSLTTPWWMLVIGLIVPPAGFVAAVLLSRGRSLTMRVLISLVGLGTVNALALSQVQLVNVILSLQAAGG